MSTTCLSAKRLAVATLYVLVVPVLVVAAFMAVPSNAPGTTPAPHASYDRLMHVLQAGDGKQIDDGFFELYCDQASAPTGWIWAVDDTRDGDATTNPNPCWRHSPAIFHIRALSSTSPTHRFTPSQRPCSRGQSARSDLDAEPMPMQ